MCFVTAILRATSTIYTQKLVVQLYLQKHLGFRLSASVSFEICLLSQKSLQAKLHFSTNQLEEHLGESYCANWVKPQ